MEEIAAKLRKQGIDAKAIALKRPTKEQLTEQEKMQRRLKKKLKKLKLR